MRIGNRWRIPDFGDCWGKPGCISDGEPHAANAETWMAKRCGRRLGRGSRGKCSPRRVTLVGGDFDTIFTGGSLHFIGNFMRCGSIVGAMNAMILRAREMSLALLVVAVIDHGHVQVDYSGATPQSSGLMRLGRDLMRRASWDPPAVSNWSSSRNRQVAHYSPKGLVVGAAKLTRLR